MKRFTLYPALLLCLLCSSCSEQSPYHTKGVSISIVVRQVSAGIVQAEFVPSSDAFFFYGIALLDSTQTTPYIDEQQFMDKVLNRAYSDYMDWRYRLNLLNTPYIASFADHSLAYGKTEKFFTNLWPDQRYYIYAFVVDPQHVAYTGHVFGSVVATTSLSVIDASFDMTIDRDWDFVYPVDNDGALVSDMPYRVSIVSKQTILDHFDGDTFEYFNKPAWYFLFNVLSDTASVDSTYITNPELSYLGVSCRRHDGKTPDIVQFHENQTYYASICSADGLFLDKTQTIYRFTWNGPDTHIELFHDKDAVGYHW